MAGLCSLALGVGAVFFFFLLIRKVLKTGRNGPHPPLPPGPKGLPIVGNLLDLPKPGDYEAKHWIKHKDIYGPSCCVRLFQNLDCCLTVVTSHRAHQLDHSAWPNDGDHQ